MNDIAPKATAEWAASKVPEVALGFWVIKIAATTLGETGGDRVSMSLGFRVDTGRTRAMRFDRADA